MTEYLEILGRLFYLAEGEVAGYWAGLPEERREAFLARAQEEGASGFVLWRLGADGVGSEAAGSLRLRRESALVEGMRREAMLRRLYAFLEERGIRFAPFKGADLAFRVYPSPSMRPFGDFDIFFHPEDIDRARQEMLSDGWREEGSLNKASNHHYAPLHKNHCMVEPHWTLSCFGETPPEAIWRHAVSVSGSRHVLSPELNILAFARHASERQYRWIALSKLLLDCGMVIRHDGCDWAKLRAVCAELGQPYAGNLLAAFPEFFPEQLVAAMAADAEATAAYRRIFEERDAQKELSLSEVTVIQGGLFTRLWWSARLSMLHPANIRLKYKLPARGARGRLAWAYVRDIALKSWQFVRYSVSPHRETKDYLALIDKAERM